MFQYQAKYKKLKLLLQKHIKILKKLQFKALMLKYNSHQLMIFKHHKINNKIYQLLMKTINRKKNKSSLKKYKFRKQQRLRQLKDKEATLNKQMQEMILNNYTIYIRTYNENYQTEIQMTKLHFCKNILIKVICFHVMENF